MKKNVLAVSIAAMIGGLGFAGVASAGNVISNAGAVAVANDLSVSTDGTGHILLVPYFSTQNGNVSLLNITNTDQVNGKAVKLRYRGAANSDDVYDITLFLSPGDMWSANVSNNNGISTLTTNDNSCTLPASVNADFSTARVRGGDAGQTREGYIEILNVADVPKNLAADDGTEFSPATANPLYAAIKHATSGANLGVPNCAAIADQTKDVADMDADPTAPADVNAANARGYSFPTGGLMANWFVMNLSKAGSFTGEATALVASVGGNKVPAQANIVFSPQDGEAQGAGGSAAAIGALTADPLLAGGVEDDGVTVVAPTIPAVNFDFPDLSTPYVAGVATPTAQANMLSGALATLSVTNEYMTSPSVSFATDWTFSMPSRRYNVALDYTAPQAVYNAGAIYFRPDNAKLSTDKTQICVTSKYADLQYYDTSEQGKAAGGYVISPQPAGQGLSFCGETSVLGFNQGTFAADSATTVLGALIARQSINTVKAAKTTEAYTDGWMSIQTLNTTGAAPAVNNGLPIIGHAFVKAMGPTSLGGIFKHRTNLVNK
ncbi:cell surface protein [Diaphorobacter nitroreducens]|uniref:cell surface protein n=1 Tax=Diaphorobacter nitroreducens TaxID=164759 RepID=UPI0028980BB0|nr:cell surface protein [Diaphorobacter nitroreducens]